MLSKLLSTSIIVGVFLVGCGEEVRNQDLQIGLTPHQTDIKLKNSREFEPEGEEYLNYMKTYNLNSRIFSIDWIPYPNVHISLKDKEHRNSDLKYVFYFDVDGNKDTGYYNKWVPNAGAEYLVEDGITFKYTGTPGTNEWSWEVIDWHANSIKDSVGATIEIDEYYPNQMLTTYGITLNKDDWSYNGFLGYNYMGRTHIEDKVSFSEETNREFTITKYDEDVYFHSYKKDYQKLDDNEAYYNYEFSVNGTSYYVEGNTLFNKADNTILANNLLYEIREYDAITIIPKRYLENGDIKMDEVTIRDSSWDELYSSSNQVERSLDQKISSDLKEMGYTSSIFLSAEITNTGKVLVRWKSNWHTVNLALFSTNGENVSFDKHLLLSDVNDFGFESLPTAGNRPVELEKVANSYIVKFALTNADKPYMHDVLIDSNGDFISILRWNSGRGHNPELISYRQKGDIFFVIENNPSLRLKIVNAETNQVTEKIFDVESPNGLIRPSSKIEDNVLIVDYYIYSYLQGYRLVSRVKYDINDSNNVTIISVEENL